MEPTDKKRIGFARFSPEQLRALSRKGGQARVAKGFALLDEEERKINARKGALAMHEKQRKLRKERNVKNSISRRNTGND